jgi:beta-glucosidase
VAMTWPKSWDDEPPFNNKAEETVMPFLHGYRYFDDKGIEPLYPFGYGLSYTTFKYSNLQVPCSDITGKGVIDVKVDVSNTGDMDGDAVAYLFVGYPKSKVQRAKKDLKGFQRVSLKAGQTKRITIQLHISDLEWWNEPSGFEVEKTTYEIMVGGSSVDLPLKDSFVVK